MNTIHYTKNKDVKSKTGEMNKYCKKNTNHKK